MRVVCPECLQKAKITHRNELTVEVVDLYCSCSSCGHSFVSKLAFSHTVTPGKHQYKKLMIEFMKNMDPAERRDLVSQVESGEVAAGI